MDFYYLFWFTSEVILKYNEGRKGDFSSMSRTDDYHSRHIIKSGGRAAKKHWFL